MIWAWLVGCSLVTEPLAQPETWPAPGTPLAATSVKTGGSTTCAQLDDGRLACWGAGEAGELGQSVPLDCAIELEPNHTASRPCSASPHGIEGLGRVDAYDVGGGHGCALKGGEVWCWGGNPVGVLGFRTRQTCRLPYPGLDRSPCQHAPGKVPGLPPIAQISAGSDHSCALTAEGVAYCWGGSALGVPPTEKCPGVSGAHEPCMPPTKVPGVPALSSIEAGTETTCAIDRDGGLWCWGQNELGRMGDGTAEDRVDPVKLALSDVTEVELSPSHGCAIAGGEVWCWGSAWHQETGTTGSEACPARMGVRDLGFHIPCEPAPVKVPGLSGASDLTVSGANSCVRRRGETICWGRGAPGLTAERTGEGPRTVGRMERSALGNDFACGIVEGVVHCIGDDRARAHGSDRPLAQATALTW